MWGWGSPGGGGGPRAGVGVSGTLPGGRVGSCGFGDLRCRKNKEWVMNKWRTPAFKQGQGKRGHIGWVVGGGGHKLNSPVNPLILVR